MLAMATNEQQYAHLEKQASKMMPMKVSRDMLYMWEIHPLLDRLMAKSIHHLATRVLSD